MKHWSVRSVFVVSLVLLLAPWMSPPAANAEGPQIAGSPAGLPNGMTNVLSGTGLDATQVLDCSSYSADDGLAAALSLGGSITFACSGTIVVPATIVISQDTTLDATGQAVTISGNDAVRVFAVNAGIQLTLKHLTVANGRATGLAGTDGGTGVSGGPGGDAFGGGLYNLGGLVTIEDSAFAGCQAVGGRGGNGGPGYPGHSYCCRWDWLGRCTGYCWSPGSRGANGGGGGQGYGGGIYNTDGGSITVIDSRFSGNSVTGGAGGNAGYGESGYGEGGWGGHAYGGGLYHGAGGLEITRSSLSASSATGGYPGNGYTYAPWANSFGGGLYAAANATLVNVTVSANTASGGYAYGGGLYNASTMILRNVTLTANSSSSHYGSHGGGVNNGAGTVSVSNSILANNGPQNCTGTISSLTHNLDSGNSCAFTAVGDVANTDPRLGPLQDNGGGSLSQALLAGSPAVDAGNPSSPGSPDDPNRCATEDQRLVARAQHDRCDIGAYEAVWVALTTALAGVDEGIGSAPMAVTLSGLSPITVTAAYTASDGTAVGGSDYAVTTGTLPIPPNVISQTIRVPIVDDLVDEPVETFTLTLSSPAHALLDSNDRTVVRIVDNDWFDLAGSLKAASAAVASAGDVLTYTIVLSNSGNIGATATLTDPIPAGLAVLTPTLTGGAAYNDAAHRVEYSGTVPGHSRQVVSFAVQVGVMASGTALTNVASIGDGQSVLTRTAVVTVVNAPPAAHADGVVVLEDHVASVDLLANDMDPEGDPLLITMLSTPLHGTATISATATANYTPTADFNGADLFTYTVSDGHGGSDSALVTVTVISVNDPPLVDAGPDRAGDEGDSISFQGTAVDQDGDAGLLAITWSFGDGAMTSGTLAPAHIYADGGPYTVTLVVTDTEGGVGRDTALVQVAFRYSVYLPLVVRGGSN